MTRTAYDQNRGRTDRCDRRERESGVVGGRRGWGGQTAGKQGKGIQNEYENKCQVESAPVCISKRQRALREKHIINLCFLLL